MAHLIGRAAKFVASPVLQGVRTFTGPIIGLAPRPLYVTQTPQLTAATMRSTTSPVQPSNRAQTAVLAGHATPTTTTSRTHFAPTTRPVSRLFGNKAIGGVESIEYNTVQACIDFLKKRREHALQEMYNFYDSPSNFADYGPKSISRMIKFNHAIHDLDNRNNEQWVQSSYKEFIEEYDDSVHNLSISEKDFKEIAQKYDLMLPTNEEVLFKIFYNDIESLYDDIDNFVTSNHSLIISKLANIRSIYTDMLKIAIKLPYTKLPQTNKNNICNQKHIDATKEHFEEQIIELQEFFIQNFKENMKQQPHSSVFRVVLDTILTQVIPNKINYAISTYIEKEKGYFDKTQHTLQKAATLLNNHYLDFLNQEIAKFTNDISNDLNPSFSQKSYLPKTAFHDNYTNNINANKIALARKKYEVQKQYLEGNNPLEEFFSIKIDPRICIPSFLVNLFNDQAKEIAKAANTIPSFSEILKKAHNTPNEQQSNRFTERFKKNDQSKNIIDF